MRTVFDARWLLLIAREVASIWFKASELHAWAPELCFNFLALPAYEYMDPFVEQYYLCCVHWMDHVIISGIVLKWNRSWWNGNSPEKAACSKRNPILPNFLDSTKTTSAARYSELNTYHIVRLQKWQQNRQDKRNKWAFVALSCEMQAPNIEHARTI